MISEHEEEQTRFPRQKKDNDNTSQDPGDFSLLRRKRRFCHAEQVVATLAGNRMLSTQCLIGIRLPAIWT